MKRKNAKQPSKTPLDMTAQECASRLAAARRDPRCLPQDIEYWQWYIDFHNYGRSVTAANDLAESRRSKPRVRIKATSTAAVASGAA